LLAERGGQIVSCLRNADAGGGPPSQRGSRENIGLIKANAPVNSETALPKSPAHETPLPAKNLPSQYAKAAKTTRNSATPALRPSELRITP
jgi:hypothetical protein